MDNDNNTPYRFTELAASFLRQQESIRDGVAVLLGDALHGCAEDQRALHVERAFVIYESLAAMPSLLWKVVELPHDLPR